VLDSVGARPKARVPTLGTRPVTGTMSLLVHVQLILAVEIPSTFMAYVRRLVVVAIDTITATRGPVALHPLIVAVVSAAFPVATLRTVTAHHLSLVVSPVN
jgi:hypothetical protein